MCVCVCERERERGCLDKYNSAATWPPQTKILSFAPAYIATLFNYLKLYQKLCSVVAFFF